MLDRTASRPFWIAALEATRGLTRAIEPEQPFDLGLRRRPAERESREPAQDLLGARQFFGGALRVAAEDAFTAARLLR